MNGLRPDTGYSYIGRASCGCACAIAMDFADAWTRRTVGEWMRDGLSIERHHNSQRPAYMLSLVCLHKPRFGGPRPYEDCPECGKDVKVGKRGQLYAHRPAWRSWGDNCEGSGRVMQERAA